MRAPTAAETMTRQWSDQDFGATTRSGADGVMFAHRFGFVQNLPPSAIGPQDEMPRRRARHAPAATISSIVGNRMDNPMRTTFPRLLLLALLTLAAPTCAQVASPAPDAAVTPAEAERALGGLKDPAKRAQLIETLETVAKASQSLPQRSAAAAKPAEAEMSLKPNGLGAQLVVQAVVWAREASSELVAATLVQPSYEAALPRARHRHIAARSISDDPAGGPPAGRARSPARGCGRAGRGASKRRAAARTDAGERPIRSPLTALTPPARW